MNIVYVEDNEFDIRAFKRLIRKHDEDFTLQVYNSFDELENSLFGDVLIRDCYLNSNLDKLSNLEPAFTVYISGARYSDRLKEKFGVVESSFFQKPISHENLEHILNLVKDQLPSLEPDYQYIKELSDGEAEFEKKMIEIYLEEVPINIAEIKKAISNDEYTQTSELIHKVRTKIRVFGLLELDELAEKLEEGFSSEIDESTIKKYKQQLSIFLLSLKESMKKIKEYNHEMYNH